MSPTTALAMVKPADAAIDDSATFCLTSGIRRLHAATGSDQGYGRQCSETTSAVCCRLPSSASWECKRFACERDRYEGRDAFISNSFRARGRTFRDPTA